MTQTISELISVAFNPASPTIMHLDLNSCFASIEQQANPLLRGKPLAVAAYVSPGGCILAASIEAKAYGVKTGLRVKEGRLLCPHLIVLPSDPDKYRRVHLRFRKLLSDYTDKVVPRSIDEFVLDLSDFVNSGLSLTDLAREIKRRIKNEIGDWLTISVGIGPNRFLAKTAAGLHKPDGLDVIDINNHQEIYQRLTLVDLHGINTQNAARLNRMGIKTVTEFVAADIQTLHTAFGSVAGYYWYLRLRGFEIDAVEFDRKSFGNSYALPKPFITEAELTPILARLIEKTTYRLRQGGYTARGVHLAIVYRDGTSWHQGLTVPEILTGSDVYRYIRQLLQTCPQRKPVRNLAVSCFNLRRQDSVQLVLFEDILKKKKLARAVDKIKRRYGQYAIASALLLSAKENVPDRIAFGGVSELFE